jgi:DNA-binding GntR family transcriptional regulator
LPVTQTNLGEAIGFSVVHVNRTLQKLRADGLITFRHNLVTVLDPFRLKAVVNLTRLTCPRAP